MDLVGTMRGKSASVSCALDHSNAPDQKRAGTAAQKVATAPVFCIWMLGNATFQNGVIPSIASSSFVIVDFASAVKCFNLDDLTIIGPAKFSADLR